MTHGIVLQGHPMELTGMRTDANTAWEEQPLVAKVFDGGPGGPGAFEGGKEQTQGLLDLGIGIQDDGLVLRVEQTDRQRHESPLRDWLCGESRLSSVPAGHGARPPT